MTLNTSRITGRISAANDDDYINTHVEFTLTGYDTDATNDVTVPASPIIVAMDATGNIDVSLLQNTDSGRERFYSVKVVTRTEEGETSYNLGKIQVSADDADINDLLPIVDPGVLTEAEALAKLQSLVDQCQNLVTDLTVEQVYVPSTTGSTADDIVLTTGEPLAAYIAGQVFAFEATADNTGAMTVNVDTLGSVSITTRDGQALTAGLVTSGTMYHMLVASPTEIVFLDVDKGAADRLDAIETAATALDANVTARQRHFTLTLGGGSTANALTGTTGQSITEYRNGDAFTVNPASDNTGAMTFEADGLGSLTFNARENTPMAAGMVKASERITVRLESVGETFRAILMDLSKAEFERINLIEADATEAAGRVAEIEQTVSDYAVLTPSEGITTGGFVSVDTGDVVSSASFKYAYYTVEQNRVYKLSGQPNGGTTALATWIDAAGDVISTNFPGESGGSSATVYVDEEITSPAGAVKLGMSQNVNRDAAFEAKGPTVSPNIAARVASVEALPFAGKTATVFGTSIWTGTGPENSLAQLLGTATGLTINQQTTASLIFRAGFVADVDVAGGDPYGWFGKRATQITRSLMQTTAQKQFLIDNWATFFANFDTTGSYSSTLTPEEEAEILAYSYEQRLVADSLGANATDYYIFGDCYNDQADGDDIATATGEIGATGVYEDTNTYIGSMNLMMRLILESNPSAKFIMAGHFENQRIPSIAAAQTIVATDWSIPLIKTWEDLGWSQKLIEWNGDWNADTVSSYSFVPGASNIDTVLKRNVPGGVHPYFDSTGAANAAIIAAIKSNMTRLAP